MRLIDVPMGENDINAKTVGEFLKTLLVTLWNEGEGFSGKRPFGNSDWQWQVHAALIKAGYEIGTLDEEGYIETLDWSKADKLVVDAISEVFAEPVRHGRWVMKETMIRSPYAKNAYCSECLEETGYAHNYCPNCGAKMEQEG